MRSTMLIALVCSFLCEVCAPVGPKPVEHGDPLSNADLGVARARALSDRGDHLGASRYLEAALSRGATEQQVLPLLVCSQVRSGRLLAATETTGRLLILNADHPHLEELHNLLEQLSARAFAFDKEGDQHR